MSGKPCKAHTPAILRLVSAVAIWVVSGWAYLSVVLDVGVPDIGTGQNVAHGAIVIVTGTLVLVLQQWSFVRTSFGDPGTVQSDVPAYVRVAPTHTRALSFVLGPWICVLEGVLSV